MRLSHLSGLILLLGLTVLAAIASLHIGLRVFDPATVWAALTAPDGSADHLIIEGLRLPRTLVAVVVGAALATSGLLMQAVFRNPLAEPGLLGVNAGASFAVVVGFAVFGVSSLIALSLLALVGAFLAMAAIFALVLAARGALTPVSLVLAGVTMAAFLGAMTQVLVVIDEGTMEALLFWLAGGFADRDGPLLWVLAPVLVVGVLLAALSTRALDVMRTGDATAQALGVNTARVRLSVLALASALAAFAVVIAGPVGFVGLVAPHIARIMCGTQHGRLLPYAALIGALMALIADIAARLVVAPQEAPITAMLALIGAPVLISLIRSPRMRAIA
ncbi:MAG: iron ABC transporter permease [Pseudomonadota bacterium]